MMHGIHCHLLRDWTWLATDFKFWGCWSFPIETQRQGGTNGNDLFFSEVYDPASGTWTQTGSLEQVREQHTATLLQDGTLIVAGGIGRGTLSYVELFH